MELVRIDQKGRVQIPKRFRKQLKIKSEQVLSLSLNGKMLLLQKTRAVSEENDPVLNDMVKNPLRIKGVRITGKMLEKLKDEAWMA